MRANLLSSLASAIVLGACVLPPVSPTPGQASAATTPTPSSSAASAPESTPAPARLATRMRFPATFPHGFTAYERVDDDRGATVQQRYANAAAWQAARAGLALPAGSILLVVTHAAAKDPASGQPQRDADGRLVPGAVRGYAGMESQPSWGEAIPAPLRNGDWHYALFDAERRVRESVDQAECLACHRPRAADGFVFTLQALRAAAQR